MKYTTHSYRHEYFRTVCIDLAQFLHRTEIRLRTNILGEPARHIRPLSESRWAWRLASRNISNFTSLRAVENGANFLAEGFLFTVAASIIIGEQWRSSRSQSKRRDTVDDQLQELSSEVFELRERTGGLETRWNSEIEGLKQRSVFWFVLACLSLTMRRNGELTRILERIIWIGMKGGWTDMHNEKLQEEIASITSSVSTTEGSKSSNNSPDIQS